MILRSFDVGGDGNDGAMAAAPLGESSGYERRAPKRQRRRKQPRLDPPPREAPADRRRAQSETPHLSQRERQIVTLLIAGRSVKEASAALGLSPRTVEGYLERLKRRFGQPRLLALAVHLVKRGLVD